MYPLLVGSARQFLTSWGLGVVLERLERFLDDPQFRTCLVKPQAFARPRRLYSLRVTLKAFLTQCLSQDHSCRTAVATAKERGWLPPNASPDTAAYCRARDALSAAGLQSAVVQTGEALDACAASDQLWLGRRVRVIDGTGIALPDTPANQDDYPQPSEQSPGCGFPVLRLVAVMSLATGVVLRYAISSLHEHEQRLFQSLRTFLAPGDVVLGDRNFGTFANLVLLQRHGVDAVFRQHQARTTAGRQRTRVGKGDYLVQWRARPGHRPPGLAPVVDLPKTLWVREVTFHVTQPGFRTTAVTLVTTLLDATHYPAEALATLYGKRWAMELWLRDIKTTMGMEMLRTKTPSRVQVEVAMFLLGYNLIRAVMHDAAQTTRVALSRRKFQELRIAALNRSIAGLPASRTRMPVCWGAGEGPRSHDVPLRDIVDELLKARPAGLSIMGANGRHEHEWKVWQEVRLPDGKVLIPGVIDSTTNIIEHPEVVAERLVRYATVLGRENIIAGVDCGFGTNARTDQVDRKIAWAKLRALVEGAELATRDLWGP